MQKVLENLKKKFEIEIIQNKRSVLKRIIEGDELPSKRMVLCVGCIKSFGNHYNVELTDGWNSCWTEISNESLFFPLLQRKILSQGLKIEVVGCSLNNGKLVLPYNSTKRAAWQRKLGEVGNVYPFPISISSIKESGGVIGRVSCYVSRIYPLLYVEGNILRNKFTVTEPSSCFFECLVKDALADHTNKKVGSAIIKIKSFASEVYENIKLGSLVHFYYLFPGKPKNFKRTLVFSNKSKVLYGKKERKDLVKMRKIVDNRSKIMKEVDAVGIVTSVQKTQNNEISHLNLAGVHGNIKIIIHNPSLFGRILNMIEASTLKYMKIVAFLNVVVEAKKTTGIEVKTSNYTEIFHSNFPSHLIQNILSLKEMNLNSLLSHRQECDHFGCVCGLDN